jgi:hypothetical protein
MQSHDARRSAAEVGRNTEVAKIDNGTKKQFNFHKYVS